MCIRDSSYTTFAYDKAAVKADNGVYTVSVEVKNTGKVAGKEVVVCLDSRDVYKRQLSTLQDKG